MYIKQHTRVTMKISKFKRYAAQLACPSIMLVYLSLASSKFQASEAFLNCFTPGAFKFGAKHQQQQQQPLSLGYSTGHPGERASWYGQPTVQTPPPAYFYGRNPMSRLFGSKMGGAGGNGGGLFGNKRWMDWRLNAANGMNFYRPGYGYWSSPTQHQHQSLSPSIGPLGANYNTPQVAEQINLQPTYNTQVPNGANQLISNNPSGYGQLQQQLLDTITNTNSNSNNNNNNNEGWTVPYVNPYTRPSQQLQLPYAGGDSYSVLPGANQQQRQQQQQQQQQSGKQQVDSYGGGTKGASGSGGIKQQQQGQYGTTKNVLIANGGYASHDAHLMMGQPGYAHRTLGYSYPEWYSGSIDSPAKIAQQLYRIQQRRRNMLGL